MIMSDLPVPENTTPILPSAGISAATPHTYSHTEEVPWVDERGNPDGTHFVHVYKCSRTGALRRWGSAS